MKKTARAIVDGRYFIFVLFAAIIVYCIIGIPKVNVEYSITSYLPQDTDTRKAIDIMENEFKTFGSSTIMIRNISFDEADELHNRILNIDGIKSLEFKNTEDYYFESSALFQITFDGDSEDEVSKNAYSQALKTLEGYDILISSELVSDYADKLQADINFVLLLAIAVILAVLLFTSESFAEIIVFFAVFGVSALLNMGTNFWLGSISFVSNSVCIILQLALAIDYAIILCHRFSEEKSKNLSPNDAMAEALSKAIPEIAGSSLTTIAGLLALTCMSLRLGADLGIVLAKSILCSLFTVFLLMPGITLSLSKPIDKTSHKSFVPKITFIGKFVVKFRYVLVSVFLVAVSVCCYFSFQTKYVYSTSSIDTDRPTSAMTASKEIESVFDSANVFAILVPSGDYDLQRSILKTVEREDMISSALGIANVELSSNGTTYYLTDSLNYRQLALFVGMDETSASEIFAAYAFLSKDNTRDGISELAVYNANRDIYRASILELCNCAFEHDDFISAYMYDDSEALENYENIRDTIKDAQDQLTGENFDRLVFNINGDVESDETFALISRLLVNVKTICPEAIFAGDSMSSYDLNESFVSDNVLISVLTIAFVFVILMFTFASYGLPVPLVFTIQGAIFINFSRYAFSSTNLFFFVYLIVSAIQMGATIDYAIVIANRFEELKKTNDKKTAAVMTLNQAFPTIITSGTIMAVAGFLIGNLVSDPLIATLGECLGYGVIISISCVMLILPGFLLICDNLLEKTAFKIKKQSQNAERTARKKKTLGLMKLLKKVESVIKEDDKNETK